jgi:hypothetical protein
MWYIMIDPDPTFRSAVKYAGRAFYRSGVVMILSRSIFGLLLFTAGAAPALAQTNFGRIYGNCDG